ncbi:MAG: PucR family transcriptional regulator, partial [Thermacetogeniaceae bacterium]
GKSLKVLASNIAEILKCPLLIIDSNNSILARSPYNNQGSILLNRILENRELCNQLFASDEGIQTLPETIRYRVDIRELASAGKYLGKLLLFWDRTFSTMEEVAANEVCQALKFVLLQEMAKREETERARREFIDELLSGRIKREDVALSRAEYFNCKIPTPSLVMIIEFESYESLHKGKRENTESYRVDKVRRFRDESIKIVEAVMAEAKFECIVIPRGNLLIAIFNINKEQSEHIESVKKIGKRIEEKLLQKDDSIDFIIAFGNQYSKITELHKSYNEALKTVNIARIVFSQTRCIHVTELGIYYYLPELLTDKNLNEYIDKVLNVIEKFDREKEAGLLETFKLLLFEDGNTVNLADKLYVHRNTLLYRKKKIQQLLGEDPFSYPLKLNYQLVILLAQLRKKLGIVI